MSEAIDRLSGLLAGAPARAGETRVLAIDGRSGAGKSTLAASTASALRAPWISLEELYGGWDGLRAGIELLVDAVLAPLAECRPASVPRYDWVSSEWMRPTALERPPVLIVEGVGAGALAAAPYLSALAWVELSEESRRARAMARDGALYGGHWEMWSEQEEEYLRTDRPAERADLVLADLL